MFDLHNFLDIRNLEPFFTAHPYWALITAFIVACTESLAVVGVIVPGAVTMSVVGFLIGLAIIPFGKTLIAAILGAIVGDCLSYLLGIYLQGRIDRVWPFTRWPTLLEQSEHFFRRHGGKSIFIGRFVGPMRPMIPMIAGVAKMALPKFLFAALPSAALWAFAYLLPGILLGAISLELPPKLATQFILWALLILVGTWTLIWLIQHFFRQTYGWIDRLLMKIWRCAQNNSSWAKITDWLSDPQEPDNHNQLTLLLLALLAWGLFGWLTYQVPITGLGATINRGVYYLLASIRTPWLDCGWVAITILGNPSVLLIFSGLLLGWLLLKRNWYAAAHWFAATVLSVMATTGIKLWIYSPRPGEILYDLQSSSFPSAHVAFTTTCYGFLAAMIARTMPQARRHLPYIIVASLVTLIAFSRIYLGAHWLTDIIGGGLLGIGITLLIVVSYRRRHEHGEPMGNPLGNLITKSVALTWQQLVMVSGKILVGVWVGYLLLAFHSQFHKYQMIWPQREVTLQELASTDYSSDLCRRNRFGRPIEALNLIYLGSLTQLKDALTTQGWENRPLQFDWRVLLKGLTTNSSDSHLPIFPQLHHNQRLALLLTRNTAEPDTIMMLGLWPANLKIKDSSQPAWVGYLEYHHQAPKLFSKQRWRNWHKFVGATDFFVQHPPAGFNIQRQYYPPDQQPPETIDLQWDGQLLLLREITQK